MAKESALAVRASLKRRLVVGKFCLVTLLVPAVVYIGIQLLGILGEADYIDVPLGEQTVLSIVWGGLFLLVAALPYGNILPPLGLFCGQCGKFTPADSKWVCGFCLAESTGERGYSFVLKCEKCRQETKAFICPHCEAMNFVD